MKLNISLLIFTSILSIRAYAQEKSCDCPANINETIAKTEANYAGFPVKITAKNRPEYNRLVSSLKNKARTSADNKSCFELCREYVRFFNDKHFSLSFMSSKLPAGEIIPVNEAMFSNLKPARNSPEGIWTNPDSTLKLGIRKYAGNIYKAIVLESRDTTLKKGLVYFTLQPHKKGFLLTQYNVFSTLDFYARQRGALLQLWNFALYGRISSTPMNTAEKAELATWRDHNNGLDFKQLDTQTAYIRIPTFYNNDSKIEKLVATNDKAIRNSKYLIIDLRGNGGGNSGWSNLLPYVMTDPISQDSVMLRVSPDNVRLRRSELEYFVTQPLPGEMKKYYTDELVARLKKAYDELPSSKATFYPVPSLTIPVDAVLQKPEKVALITDGLCGSSAEYFFHLLKQSRKTTRYGSNTVGMMDYEGPTSRTPLPCNEMVLMIPIAKSAWTDQAPIDLTGFKPDVMINKPENEWLDYIVEDLKKSR